MNWIRSTWCKNMHTEAMWPIHGKYICPRCLREYPVAWEGPATAAGYAGVCHAPETVPYAAQQNSASVTLC